MFLVIVVVALVSISGVHSYDCQNPPKKCPPEDVEMMEIIHEENKKCGAMEKGQRKDDCFYKAYNGDKGFQFTALINECCPMDMDESEEEICLKNFDTLKSDCMSKMGTEPEADY